MDVTGEVRDGGAGRYTQDDNDRCLGVSAAVAVAWCPGRVVFTRSELHTDV